MLENQPKKFAINLFNKFFRKIQLFVEVSQRIPQLIKPFTIWKIY